MYSKVLPLLALVGVAHSHMRLEYPPILKGDNNPNTQGEPDPFSHYPYGCCGQEVPGPCRGHIDLLDTDEGKPVVEWAPGQKANFTLSGKPVQAATSNVEGGTHYGGSCQVGFSVDKGKTFKVATTWQGNCPLRQNGIEPSGQVFDFTLPADIPSTERALFAWVWVNREKEFFMTCASVTIGGGNGQSSTQQPESQEPVDEEPGAQNPAASPAPSQPEGIQPPNEDPERPSPRDEEEGETKQYTLEGCSCSCPSQTWSQGCECFECKSPATKRHLVERKALEMHKRHLLQAEKLNAPHRRAESIPWASRPAMLTSVDFEGAQCRSQGNPSEMKFPDPGPDVVEGDGEYELAEPTC